MALLAGGAAWRVGRRTLGGRRREAAGSAAAWALPWRARRRAAAPGSRRSGRARASRSGAAPRGEVEPIGDLGHLPVWRSVPSWSSAGTQASSGFRGSPCGPFRQRVKTEPTFEVARGALLLRMRRDQRRVEIDRQRPGRAMKSPEPVAHAPRATHPAAGLRGDPVDHPERRRVRRDHLEQRLLTADGGEIGHALAAVGKHHRQIPDHPSRIMPTPTLLHAGQAPGQRPREPQPGHPPAPATRPARDTNPSPSAATSTVKERPPRITFRVTSRFGIHNLRRARESRLHLTNPRPRQIPGRGRYCTIRARRSSKLSYSLFDPRHQW